MPKEHPTLADLEAAAKNVTAVFERHRKKYGAEDTEPRANLRGAIYRTVTSGQVRLPTGQNHWEIFSSVKGWRTAEREMDEAVSELLGTLLNLRIADIGKAKELMTQHFWVSWEAKDYR